MNLRQNRCLAGAAIAMTLTGLGCGKKDVEKPQVFVMQGETVKAVAAVAATPVIWTITINPGPTVGSQCTADVPWQEMYGGPDKSNNDFVRFKAKNGPQQTYRVMFPSHNTPLDTDTIDNITTTPSALHQVNIDPSQQCGPPSNNTCAYPYGIYNITNPRNPVQCNNGNNGPPYGVGSDGIVIKCGTGC